MKTKQIHVGIISKPSHAKAHAERLKKEGYSVELLGGKPSRLPTRCDVIVCRIASSSHAGFDLANAARVRGRPVIFEDGVTGILNELRELNETYEEGVKMGVVEDRKPVIGKRHRAYFSAKAGKWTVRYGERWKRFVKGSARKTREEAEALVAKLDAEEKEEVKVFPEPKKLPEPPKPRQAPPAPPAEPAEPDLMLVAKNDLTEWAEGLLDEMKNQKLLTFKLGNMTVTIEATHLTSPDGAACGVEGESTLALADVTCPDCLASEQYKLMSWLNTQKESAT